MEKRFIPGRCYSTVLFRYRNEPPLAFDESNLHPYGTMATGLAPLVQPSASGFSQ